MIIFTYFPKNSSFLFAFFANENLLFHIILLEKFPTPRNLFQKSTLSRKKGVIIFFWLHFFKIHFLDLEIGSLSKIIQFYSFHCTVFHYGLIKLYLFTLSMLLINIKKFHKKSKLNWHVSNPFFYPFFVCVFVSAIESWECIGIYYINTFTCQLKSVLYADAFLAV